MRFGVCTKIEKAEIVIDAGYDYIELSAAADLIPEGDENDWNERRREIDKMSIFPEAFNSFIRTGKITGPDADPTRLKKYVNTALIRANQIGGKIVVFGSNGARNVPDGFPLDEAVKQIEDFLTMCADASDQTGVTVVIEPLHRGESNIVNLVSEGAALTRKINRKGVRNLADTFHMEMENEPMSAVLESADVLAHVHTADTGRFAPGTGSYDHVALFRALHEAGYDDRLSIECDWNDKFDDSIGYSLTHLKRAYIAANS